MEHIISKANQYIGEQIFSISEIANTSYTTTWSDGTAGEYPTGDPAAKPETDFFVTFELKMHPLSSPPYSESSLKFGYGGLSKESLKEELMKLIMKF